MNTNQWNQNTFDRQLAEANAPVLIDFYADWCGPCRMVGPVVDEVAREHAGRAVVAKVNVDESPVLAERYGVTSIPTFIVFQGGQPVRTLRGIQSKASLAASLAAAA